MNRGRLLLVIVVIVLGVLVVLDNADLDPGSLWDGQPISALPRPPSAVVEDRLRALQRAISTREDIERAYSEVAVRYATKAAELDTLMLDARDPRRVALDVITRRLRGIRHLEVKRTSAGEPRPQGDGVSLISVSLALEAPTHEAAMQALLELSRPDRGYAWEAFDLQADADAKRIQISGEVLTLVVEAAE